MSYPPQPPQQQPPQPPQPGQYQQAPQYQQPQYQQPGYGQFQQGVVQPQTSPVALTGFIMALACVILFWWPFPPLGWLLNLTAFILSIVGNSQIKKSEGRLTGKGFAVAGIVISSVVFGLFLLALIAGLFIGAAIFGGLLGGLK